ncbi:MAG: hypothetical protein E7256_01295 [Lachnospiraceae bacterium]|nr:hypothetical protein [Lachnospiraceae bacterium]
MKKNMSNLIWGAVFILAGLFIAGKAFNLFTFNIFFDGWWTLFIIVPCFIGLFNNRDDRSSNIVGLIVGILLLLSAQDIIRWRMMFPLCLAAIFVYVGLKMVFGKEHRMEQDKYTSYQSYDYKDNTYESGNYTNNTNSSNDTKQQSTYQEGIEVKAGEPVYSSTGASSEYAYQSESQGNTRGSSYSGFRNGHAVCTAVLSAKEIRFNNELFQGAVLSSVLGGIELDLRNGIIQEDVVIEARAVLGGIDIMVPGNVRVAVNCTPILGGVENSTRTPFGANEHTPTIFLNATCVLGGIDVK